MAGSLVGINTAIYSQTGGSIGIGFAIPSNMVSAVVGAAKSGQTYFERPYLGAEFDPVTGQVAEALGLSRPAGALVSNVDAESPAAKADIRPGDVVLALNGGEIDNPEALDYRLATQPLGSSVDLTLLRKGEKLDVEVALERAPEGTSAKEVTIGGRSPFTGAKVATLSPRLAQRLHVRTGTKGVVVVGVDGSSPAAGLGLQPGDIVRDVNGVEIDTPETLAQVTGQDTRWWRFSVDRNGQTLRQMLRY